MVAPPRLSPNYRLSASVGGRAVTAYKPCELVTISIDVLDRDAKYLGLLL